MLSPLWNQFLYFPLLNALVGLYSLTGNLGWAIVFFTAGLRGLMTPLVIPSMRTSKKIQELGPELAKIKEQHKDNKTTLMTAQSELYKKNGVNPAAGCLPQLIQLLVLIALFNALNALLHSGSDIAGKLNSSLYSFNQLPQDFKLSTQFFGLDLVKPDIHPVQGLPFPLPGVFLFISSFVQLLSTKMMSPQTLKKADNKEGEDMESAMLAAQQQMIYTIPLLTLVFGAQFPSGLVLYWFVFSLVSMLQQYVVTGWGGLTPWLSRLGLVKSRP